MPHAGIAALNATTGAVDPFMSVQFAGHHNDTGSGAQGSVGPWKLDVTPDGRQMVAIGNFKTADGLLRDQVAQIDLAGSRLWSPNWATNRYSPVLLQLGLRQLRPRGHVLALTARTSWSHATGGGSPGHAV